MKNIGSYVLKILPFAAILIGVIAIAYWLTIDGSKFFTLSEPGMDGYADASKIEENVIIGEFFQLFGKEENTLNESWPRFRGENSDNKYLSGIKLIDSFENNQAEILWKIELGEGHAGAAIYKGLVYVLDYDEDIRADMLRCFSLTSGEEIWRRWYHVQIRRNHGISRTVPAVTDKYIVSIGPRGHVMCLEREGGKFLWGIDLEKEFETEIPLWYTGQCPLIIDDIAVIAVAGNSLLIGVNCETGELAWSTPNKNGWKMSHSSIIPYEFKGQPMLVYAAIGGVVGVKADGSDAGKILWESSAWNNPVVAPSPVCLPDGKIFLTAGYGAGSMLMELKENNGGFSIAVLSSFKPGEGLSSEQQTPVYDNGYLYGVLPKDARTLRNQFVCVKADKPSEIVWSSGPTARFGLGPYLLANNTFVLLDDDASLYIIQKSQQQYIELAKVKLFEGVDAWAPIAIADGFLVLRDSREMLCINLNKK